MSSPSRLRLLTFNVGLLEFRLCGLPVKRPLPALAERLAALPAAIAALEADVVALQELYWEDHLAAFLAVLAPLYPYRATRPRGRLGPCLPGSLLLLSRLPIQASGSRRFSRAMPDERLAAWFGLQWIEVEPAGLPRLRLVNAHTTAGGLFGDPEAARTETLRAHQLAELQAACEAGAPAILLGDLNCGTDVSPDNFHQLLRAGYRDTLRALHPGAADAELVTWDSRQPLNAPGPHRHQSPQRIDHVLLAPRAVPLLRPVAGGVVLREATVASPLGMVTPSDHYGVLVELGGREDVR